MDYFRKAPDVDVTSPSQIAVVGDRLFTDVMMANMMGSYGVWVKDGVVTDTSVVGIRCFDQPFSQLAFVDGCSLQFTGIEKRLASILLRRGYCAPDPRSDFE